MSTIVIMPGGFHPFHAGHAALYQSAVKAFPGAEVFVAATNDTSTRPFPFAIKEKLAKLAGVAPGHFVQVKSPFRAEEITAQFDPAKDRLIFVRSEKDANKPPQAGGNKKDGSPAYLQPLAGQTNIRPFKEHAYMAYLPTVEFGPGMTSATEIRTAWPQLNDKRKQALVMSLYPQTQSNPALAKNVVKMLDTAIGTETTDLNEAVGGNYLYHSTQDADTAKKILSSGAFKAGTYAAQAPTDAQTKLPTVSFGRSLEYQLSGANVGRNYQVVFVIDRNALESRYKTLGTSQSKNTRGMANVKKNDFNYNQFKYLNPFDANKDNQLSKDELDVWQQQTGGISAPGNKLKTAPNDVADIYQELSQGFSKTKAGGEFEEVVPTRTGSIPWQGMLVGFYLVPGKAAANDPELLNHPLRLEMPSPNNFVRANGTAPANKPVLTPAQRQQQKQAGQEKSRQMAMTKVTAENQGWAATFTSEESGQMAGTPAIGGMWAGYQQRENQPIDEDYIDEKWSQKYKSSINCASPKGFSQRAHCAGRKK